MQSATTKIAYAKVEQNRRGSISRSKTGTTGPAQRGKAAPSPSGDTDDNDPMDEDDMAGAGAPPPPTHGMLGGFPKGLAVGLRAKRRGLRGPA